MTLETVQEWLVTIGLRILLTLVLAVVALWVLRRLIDRVVDTMSSRSAQRLAESGRAGRALAAATGLADERQRQRVETVASLLRSIVTFVVVTLAVLTIMALLGIPLGPLLASAGCRRRRPRVRGAEPGQGLPRGGLHDHGGPVRRR